MSTSVYCFWALGSGLVLGTGLGWMDSKSTSSLPQPPALQQTMSASPSHWPEAEAGSMMSRLGHADPQVVIAAAREILTEAYSAENQWWQRLAAMRWAQLDAVGFFSEHSADLDADIVDAAALAWAEKDPAATLRWLATYLENNSRRTTAFEVVSRTAPQVAKEYLQEMKRGNFPVTTPEMKSETKAQCDPSVYRALLIQIGRHADPTWALDQLNIRGDLTDGCAAQILRHWAGKDAAAAVAWSTALENQTDRLHAVGTCLGALGESNPDLALELYHKYPEAAERIYLDSDDIRVMNSLAATLIKRDGLRAFAEIATWQEEHAFSALHTATEHVRIPAEGPQALLDQLADLKSSDEENYSLIRRLLYEAWEPKHPVTALNDTLTWDDAYTFGPEHVQQEFLTRWIQESWDDAARWVEALPSGATKESLSNHLLEAGLQHCPNEALAWNAPLGRIPSADALEHQNFSPSVLKQLVTSQLELAATTKVDLRLLASTMTGAMPPSEVIAWMNQLPDEAHQSDAVIGLIEIWTENDPAAADQWVKSLPAGPLRDQAALKINFTPPLTTLPQPPQKP